MDRYQKRLTAVEAGEAQFRGGVVTVRPRPLLPFGTFSVLQNVRGFHPGFKKRDGQSKYHTTSQLATKVITVPAYNAGSTTYADAFGKAAAAAPWTNARDAAAADTLSISTDNADGLIVKESGGTYTVGRSYLIFDLSRYAGNTTDQGQTNPVQRLIGDIESASLFVKLNGNVTGSGAGSDEVSIIAMNGDVDNIATAPIDLNQDTTAILAAADWDLWISKDEAWSAEVPCDGGEDGDWVEIALNATAIAAIEAAAAAYDKGDWSNQSPYICIALVEYDHDYLDSQPGAGETYDAQIHLSTAANLAYLELTMTTNKSEEIVKLYQWNKGKRDERHFFAQIENGDLIEATDNPPDTITGDFGSLVYQPRDVDSADDPWPTLTVSLVNLVPASFGNADDALLYSDGMDQHKVWTGEEAPIETFKYVNRTTAIPATGNPEVGQDFSLEVTDNDPETYADVGDMGDLASDYECILIKTKYHANKFNIKFHTPNSAADVDLNLQTWDKVDGWTDVTITDNTADGGTTFAKDGSITWTVDPNEVELFACGENGYWYLLYLDASDALSSDCKISEITYEGPWQEIENVWNGVLENAIEAYVYDDGEYYAYPYTAIEIGDLGVGEYIIFSTINNLVGFHVETGATPNTNATQINVYGTKDGITWTDLSDTDTTGGFGRGGFVTWKRKDSSVVAPIEFQGSKYAAYWWKILIGTAAVSADVKITLRGMPWFDMKNFGNFGRTNTVWKERGVYSFDRFPSWLYISENNEANKLNGADYAVLQAGDGRRNSIVAMQKFHNELMVWQEELGRDGGCLTLFEGYSPQTFGKLLLSAKIGSFSQKSVVVIDGANSYTRKDDNVQTLAFFISHYGIFVTDGSVVTRISDDIQNYFDLRFSECIRRGYEKKMYVEHDTSANVLRFGLVIGSTAEQCNLFPVFDLIDWTWSFDVLGQNHTHVHEVEAESGQYPVLQMAASTNGFVYKINDTSEDQDDGTNIDMDVRSEFNLGGRHIAISEVIIRTAVITLGSGDKELDFSAYEDGVILSDATQSIDLTAPTDAGGSDRDIVRERILIDTDQASNISLRFRNNDHEGCYLYDYNVKVDIEELR